MTMRMLGIPGGNDPADDGLDLDDLETNFMTMLKIRGDISGKDFFFAFPGEAWAMVPQQQNYRAFKTFGIGAGRIEEVFGWLKRMDRRAVRCVQKIDASYGRAACSRTAEAVIPG